MFSPKNSPAERGFLPALKSSLMAGLLIVIPILVTLWIGVKIFT